MSLLRDRRDEFDRVGVHVFGISRDSPFTHIAWSQVLDLNFPLLSDWNGDAVRGFGVELAEYGNGMRGVAGRSAFLVDGSGTVRGAWRYERSDVPDFDELLAAAQGLRSS